jgi:hypothetical protein
MRTDQIHNKQLKVEAETKFEPAKKLVNPDAGNPPSARVHEIVTIETLSEDGGATGALDGYSGRQECVIDARLLAGLDVEPGDRLLIKARRPEAFGFRRAAREPFKATEIIEKEGR